MLRGLRRQGQWESLVEMEEEVGGAGRVLGMVELLRLRVCLLQGL